MTKKTKTKKTKPETAASFIRKHGVEAYARSRIEKGEERRANESGLGTTHPASALYREYGDKLEKLIADDVINPRRPHDIWAALRGGSSWPIKEITERLFRHGLNAAGASSIGFDREKRAKHPRNVALWLGDRLSQLQQRDTVLEARLGAWGITLLLQFPDIFALDESGVLILSQSGFLKRFFSDVNDRAAYANPYVLPFTKPAAPWTDVRQGPLANRIALVSRPYSEAPIQEAIENGEMSRVLGALNALQSVWFVVNKPILAIAKQLAPEIPPPPKKDSPDFAKQKERRRRAHAKARDYHSDMEFADMVAEDGRFCVPHNMDFRGRVYGIPHFNYQRADHIRGLIRFAEGERLGDGLPWLQYAVANCADGVTWGGGDRPSKLNFEGHIAWAERNQKQLCEIADDVLRGVAPGRQLLPKKTIQFLAACVELKQALHTTPVSDFITTLPISLDGCCSGLQHFCGLMWAPEGRFAGLTPRSPDEVAEDFYTEVAKIVSPYNPEIMNGPDDRTIAKPPTQIHFYAAGVEKMAEEIEETLYDLGREAEPEQIMKLAKEIKEACRNLMPLAEKVRAFVSRLASLYAENGLVFGWTTKSGFPAVQEYHKPDIRKGFAVQLGWKRVDMNLTVGDLDELRVKKSAQSAAANYVHSLDAAHLHDVVWMASVFGIPMAVAHDCFASLAPRMTKLNDIAQGRFVALHALSRLTLRDMLAAAKRDLPANTKLPELPINQGPFLQLAKVCDSRLTGWT